jgi:hypothetical protein
LVPLDGRLWFDIEERCEFRDSTVVPVFVLVLETELVYPRCCFHIIAEPRVSDGTVTVLVQGVYTDGHLRAGGRATCRTDLALDLGRHTFNFLYRGKLDRYVVNVKDDRIDISTGANSFTKPKHHRIWRFPPRSFACFCGTLAEESWICEDFLYKLTSALRLDEIRAEPSGKWPYPREWEGHYYDMPPRYFRYKRESDFDLAGEILRAYSVRVVKGRLGCTIWFRWFERSFPSMLRTSVGSTGKRRSRAFR